MQFVTQASATGQFDNAALVIGALLVAGALLAGLEWSPRERALR